MSSPKYRTRKIYSRFQSLTNENSAIRSCNSSTTGSLHSNNPLNILNSVSHRLPFIFFHGVQLFAILTYLYSLYQLPLSSTCSDTHLATFQAVSHPFCNKFLFFNICGLFSQVWHYLKWFPILIHIFLFTILSTP